MKKLKSIIACAVACLCSGILFACSDVKLTLSTQNNVTTLKPGQSVQLLTDAKDDQKDKVSFSITDGDEIADVSATGLLSIEEEANPGEKVKVVALYEQKAASNELEITVSSINLTSITATANKTEVTAGGFVSLNYTVAPVNTTEKNIVWQIVEGSDIASLSGSTLLVSDTATSGSVIKVKAVGGNVSSNIIEITVGLASSEILTVTIQDEVTIDFDSTNNSKVITANVFNANFEPVANKNVTFEIREGQENVSISTSGYDCTLSVIGHGSAILRATLDNGAYDETVINAIKAPEQILLPEVMQTKSNITYAVAKNSSIPYAVSVTGTNVCEDVEYTFSKLEGNQYVEGDFGTYNNGQITFTQTGTILVSAKSTAGSVRVPSASQMFEVNEGINVGTYEELQATITSPSYTGTPVNIVNMTKHSTYGYDIVPSFILNNQQSITNQMNAQMKVTAGRLNLNGNGYKINISGMKYFADATDNYGSFLYVYGSAVSGNTQADHYVIIKNLKMESNTPIEGSVGDASYSESLVSGKTLKGAFRRGIQVGNGDYVSYDVDFDNVEITKFQVAMRINHAVNSTISNTRVSNCFSNGIEINASIITLSNMNYGPCGGPGIEVTPDDCNLAGLNFDKNQQVTFDGTIETTNINAGNTPYFTLVGQDLGMSVTQVVNGLISQYSETQRSNVAQDHNGNTDCLMFIALMFNNFSSSTPNSSEITYSSTLQNGLINIAETSTTEIDTTHQYIIIPLQVSATMHLGFAIMYNWNYVG